MGPIDRLILQKLLAKDMHSRSFHRAKAVVRRLEVKGWLYRFSPTGSNMKNYLRISADGRVALQQDSQP